MASADASTARGTRCRRSCPTRPTTRSDQYKDLKDSFTTVNQAMVEWAERIYDYEGAVDDLAESLPRASLRAGTEQGRGQLGRAGRCAQPAEPASPGPSCARRRAATRRRGGRVRVRRSATCSSTPASSRAAGVAAGQSGAQAAGFRRDRAGRGSRWPRQEALSWPRRCERKAVSRPRLADPAVCRTGQETAGAPEGARTSPRMVRRASSAVRPAGDRGRADHRTRRPGKARRRRQPR